MVSSYLSNFFLEDINTFLKNILLLDYTDDKIWNWQFEFGSKLTIVFLLCFPMALCTI